MFELFMGPNRHQSIVHMTFVALYLKAFSGALAHHSRSRSHSHHHYYYCSMLYMDFVCRTVFSSSFIFVYTLHHQCGTWYYDIVHLFVMSYRRKGSPNIYYTDQLTCTLPPVYKSTE